MPDRSTVRTLARKHIEQNDPLGWFEPLYASAQGEAAAVPWADLKPNPLVFDWIDRQPSRAGRRALNVGCGLGDDAEELARLGMNVTAFDISATAIAWCRRRFPASAVEYVTADLLDPPAAWAGAFDFVQESYTLQVLPAELRPRAIASLARFLAPGGELLIVCRGREENDHEGQMPWPLTQEELARLTGRAGLALRMFEDLMDDEMPPVRRFRAKYQAQ